jgi:WD40 repeat protein
MDEEQRQHLMQMRKTYEKRLRILELQEARKGGNTPADIILDIDELREKIADIDMHLEISAKQTIFNQEVTQSNEISQDAIKQNKTPLILPEFSPLSENEAVTKEIIDKSILLQVVEDNLTKNKKHVLQDSVNIKSEYENRIIHAIEQKGNVTTVSFSPDGSFLAVGTGRWPLSFDNNIRIWRIDNAQISCELVGHKSKIINLSFSLDNNFIVSSSNDGTVRLWNIEGKLIKVF